MVYLSDVFIDPYVGLELNSFSVFLDSIPSSQYITNDESFLLWKSITSTERLKYPPIGLVLSGGGFKGAFEAGVWKALEGLGIAQHISAIMGTSVGALNSVLFDKCGGDASMEVWFNLKKSDVLDKRKIFRSIIKRKSIKGGMIAQNNLAVLIDRNIDLSVLNRKIFVVCKEVPYQDCDESEITVFNLSDYDKNDRRRIILASSAFYHDLIDIGVATPEDGIMIGN